MMKYFQTCIFLVFPWKNNLGQPEAEMGTFLSRRSTDFSKRRAARGLGSGRSSPIAAVAGAKLRRRRRVAELIAVVVVAVAGAVAYVP